MSEDVCPGCKGTGVDKRLAPRQVEPCADPLPACLKCGGGGTREAYEKHQKKMERICQAQSTKDFQQYWKSGRRPPISDNS